MHPNEQLLNKLFQLLNAHDHNGMAECYDEQAHFEDIAFRLDNKAKIHAMWDMICSKDENEKTTRITAEVKELSANDSIGHAVVEESYIFRETDRLVQNKIASTFEFRDGLIYKQNDKCDPVRWADQAFGGINGFFAGHVGFLRRLKAMYKLKKARPKAFKVFPESRP